ncbi:MAG: hypothetical protein LR015_14350 [Verrucomicrobia bacterium]|nr:hypothetical protein [Verrucomicrobiota bacterium]
MELRVANVQYTTLFYVGPSGGDFFEPGNWDLGRAPVDGDRIVIPRLDQPMVLENGALNLHSISSLTPLLLVDYKLSPQIAARYSGLEIRNSTFVSDTQNVANTGDLVISENSRVGLNGTYLQLGEGQILITSGASLVLLSGWVEFFGQESHLVVESGGILQVDGGRLIMYENLTLVDGGKIEVSNGDLELGGTIVFRNDAELSIANGIAYLGSFNSSVIFDSGASLVFAANAAGQVRVNSPVTVTESASWTINNGGTLYLRSDLTIGTLIIDAGVLLMPEFSESHRIIGDVEFRNNAILRVEQTRFSEVDTQLIVDGTIYGVVLVDIEYSPFGSFSPDREFVHFSWTGELLGTVRVLTEVLDDLPLNVRIESQRLVVSTGELNPIADTLIWWQLDGGDFNNPNGWNLGRVPNAGDRVIVGELDDFRAVIYSLDQGVLSFVSLEVRGILSLNYAETLRIDNTEIILAGGALFAEGEQLIIGETSILRGEGDLVAETIFGGLLTPGFSPGMIRFVGDLTLEESAQIVLEVYSATDFDSIVIQGSLIANGELVIQFMDDYVPATNLTFPLITYFGFMVHSIKSH